MIHFIARQLREWDHNVTSSLGLAFAVMPAVEFVTRLLGAVALMVGIYCSVAKEIRERRAARERHRCRP